MMMMYSELGAGELASRLRSEVGMGTWFCVLAPETRLVSISNEIAQALSAGKSKYTHILLNQNVKPLIDAPHDVLVLVSGFSTLSDDEWRHLDELRSSRLVRHQPELLIMSPESRYKLARLAPNMASFIGGQFFTFQEDSGKLTEEEKTNRLEDLRNQFGKTDDEIIELARVGVALDEPAYAEWLVLLNRGDLLKR